MQEIEEKFDIFLSNFGGLNTTDKIKNVLWKIPNVLNENGIAVLTILNPICIWEILNFPWSRKTAFRRLNWIKKKPTPAIIGKDIIHTYYYTSRQIIRALPSSLVPIKIQGLSVFVPPPYMKKFPQKYKKTFNFLKKLETRLSTTSPFNKLGDYFIISLKLIS